MSRGPSEPARHLSETGLRLVSETMLRHVPQTVAVPAVLNVAPPRQLLLGDDETAAERNASLREEVCVKLEAYGTAGPAKPKQFLDFCRNVTYKKAGGQQLEAECMFCGAHLISTGATRVVDHFANVCVLCPKSVRDPCIAVRNSSDAKRVRKDEHGVLVFQEQEQAVRLLKAQKTELRQQSIRSGFKTAEATFVDQAIARFFYANGINFGAADCSTDSYYREMVRALQAVPSGYVPPNPKALAGPLLPEAHNKMVDDVEKRDADGELSRKFGCSYTSDGWDSCDNLPLINSAYILANDGGVYQRSVDTSGFSKNAEYCASLMIADIYAIGCTKVVSVVTDTCAVMRKCWAIVQDEFPWISAAPCQTHCPSLLLTDVAKLPECAQTIRDETLVVAWFTNHHKPQAILRQKVEANMGGRSCELKKAGATRMGTNTWVGERLEELKGCLQQTVVDPAYMAEKFKDVPSDVDVINGEKVAREHKGGTAKVHVLNDAAGGFWENVRDHVSITMPLCKFLRRHDSSAPATGKVYHGWFEMGEHLENSQVCSAHPLSLPLFPSLLPPPEIGVGGATSCRFNLLSLLPCAHHSPVTPLPFHLPHPLLRRWLMHPTLWQSTKPAGRTPIARCLQLRMS